MAKRIVAVLADLIFTVRITDAARRNGVEIDVVKSGEAALEKAAGAARIILDLDFVAPEWITRLKEAGTPMVGYCSHVHTEVIRRAREAGCDVVLARSAFVQKLGELMGG